MRFLRVRDLRSNSSRIWRELPKQKEMVVTNNGRPVAILSAVSDSNLEESLAAIRQARAAAAVAAIQRQSVERGLDKMTLREIEEEIAAVRRKRSR
jgi:antitoxin (DNA-binding transcriptional repressor) of toxin-antitoxin stability system